MYLETEKSYCSTVRTRVRQQSNPQSYRNVQFPDNADINSLLINDFSIVMEYSQIMEAFPRNLLLTDEDTPWLSSKDETLHLVNTSDWTGR